MLAIAARRMTTADLLPLLVEHLVKITEDQINTKLFLCCIIDLTFVTIHQFVILRAALAESQNLRIWILRLRCTPRRMTATEQLLYSNNTLQASLND
jgi:hypothetical protein